MKYRNLNCQFFAIISVPFSFIFWIKTGCLFFFSWGRGCLQTWLNETCCNAYGCLKRIPCKTCLQVFNDILLYLPGMSILQGCSSSTSLSWIHNKISHVKIRKKKKAILKKSIQHVQKFHYFSNFNTTTSLKEYQTIRLFIVMKHHLIMIDFPFYKWYVILCFRATARV